MWFRYASLIPRLQVVIGLSLIGVVVAGISLSHHYNTAQGWCDFSAQFNCDVVNRGPYAEIARIPVALIGVVGYIGLFAVSGIALKKRDEERQLFAVVKVAVVGAFLFSLYLTYLEAFVLGVFCPLCLVSLATVIGMMVAVFVPALK